jgi:hypothetical protein
MKKIESNLILTSTNGVFGEKQVPSLYVEIQRLRGRLERLYSRQFTFQEAVRSWLEICYKERMEAANSRQLVKALPGKTTAERYLLISTLMDYEGIPSPQSAVEAVLERTGRRMRAKEKARTIA